MKIAIDMGPLKGGDSVRGVGVYVRELLKALNIEGVDIGHSDPGIYDVVHFTRFNPYGISVPFKKPKHTKFVLTIYDLVPIIFPDHYPSGVKGWINWQINKFVIGKNVDAIITISETSKKDICRFLGINPNRIFVTHLAPRKIFKKLENGNWKDASSPMLEIRKRYGLPGRFALYVGDINYNKNIPILLKSCKIAGIPLTLVGKQAKEIESMDLNHPELIHLQGLNWDGVIRPGFVPDEDLVKIYNLADVYVLPSLYEGFGLPLLEANAAGVPVVASKTQALVEIGENAALFADPNDANDFADKIKAAMGSHELVEKGIENAKKFSWEKTGTETYKIYEQ